MMTPVVTRDPRFQAGRSLVQKGLAKEGAIDIFATLVEETSTKFGTDHIETAPAYYEYGNALLRAAQSEVERHEEMEDEEHDNTINPIKQGNEMLRQAAAEAAEHRQQQQQQQQQQNQQEVELGKSKDRPSQDEMKGELDFKPAARCVKEESNGDDHGEPEIQASSASHNEFVSKVEAVKGEQQTPLEVSSSANDGATKEEGEEGDAVENHSKEIDDDDENSGSDLSLALEMMENAFSILDQYKDKGDDRYRAWTTTQLPRVLLGIGDVLSTLGRHADAADAYSRALEMRQGILAAFGNETQRLQTSSSSSSSSLSSSSSSLLLSGTSKIALTVPSGLSVMVSKEPGWLLSTQS